MADRFEFANPTRIVFGPGVVATLPEHVSQLGRRVLLVVGSRTVAREGVVARVGEGLASKGVEHVLFETSGEPDVPTVERGAQVAGESGCDLVVGLGGGSALDAAKAVAALAANAEGAAAYMEVVGRGRPLENRPLPVVAVPTTAGTGAEVTRNAVVLDRTHSYKASIRSIHLYPRVAVVDPELTRSLPPEVTASTGLDALTQLLEAFVSVRATPLSDALAREGLRRAARSIHRVHAAPGDLDARADMALASLLSGLALSNAGLGAVHGFASPLGGRYPVPHGVACAALLPHVATANVRALCARDPDGPGLHRYREAATILVGEGALFEELLVWLDTVVRELAIPPLAAYGVRPEHVPAVVEAALEASSTRGNPIVLTRDELAETLTAAIDPTPRRPADA
jgi:alcohol dehydrogenase class IV